MSEPKDLEALAALLRKLEELKITNVTAELTREEIEIIREIKRRWPEIEETLRERQQYRGFLLVGRWVFWLMIGFFMIRTYFIDWWSPAP
jgi:hypothetical protein